MENKTRKQMKTPVRILLLVVLALLVAASGFGIYFAVTGGFGGPAEPSVDLVQAEADFRAQMADSSVHEVTLSENLVLTSPVEVVGDKVITGEGSLTAAGGMEGKYLVTVPGGVSLTLSGDVKLDAAGVSGGVYVAVNGTWTLEGNAAVLNAAEGTANVMAEGKLQMQGGSLSGGYHNVVLAKGAELTWSAGTNSASISSGIVVEEGAKLSVTSKDAVLTGSGLYGIDLQGDAVIQDGTLTLSYDTMIKVAPTGTLEYKGGTMTDAGYHGIENAGTVNVTGGFINKSYNSGIVNTGKLTVTSGTIMNSTNKGIMNKLNGQAMIGGDAMISTNKFAISNEDNAYMELTSADIMASVTTNIYAYGGEMYIHDIELSASGSNNVRVVAATVTMKDVVVAGNTSSGSSTTHGILLEGGKVEATDVTIRGTKGNAVRNKGGEFIGKNITTQNIGNIAVSNRNQDVTDRQGIVTIDNLVVENSRYNNVLAEGGITTITNSVLNQAGTNNIKISDGTVVLSNVQILGNVEGAATNVHGIYITGGKLQANDIHVEHVAGAAFRVNGETAVVDVKNLTTAQLGMYSVSASVGELHFTNAVFAPTKSNNLRLDAGSMELTNVDIQGHYEGSATNVHAIYVTGGVVTAKDLDITNPTGSGLRNNGGELKVEDLSISGVGTHTLQLTGNGKTSITNAVLGEAKSNNIMLINGELNMNNVKVEGHVEGSAQNLHGILAGGGKMTGDSITFTGTSGSAIRNKGADMMLTNVTVDNFGGYNAVSNAYNDDGESYGNISIDGLVVTNALADTENLVVISNECAGSMSIVNAKLLPNTDTVTAQTNIAVHGGSVTVKDVELGKTFSNNVRVNGGVLNIENVTIPGHVEGSAANVHGLYTPGGEVIAKDLTITGTTGAGLRNAGGKVTIDNFLVENVGTHTLYISGGETVLNGATVGKTGTNNVAIHDGKVTLNDTKVLGHLETAPGDAHAIFVYGGQLDMNGVTVTGTTGSGLRVRDGEVTGKDVILENIGSSALNISGGNTTIDGVTTTNVGSNNINAWGGEIKVINAALCPTKTHNINVENGKVTVNKSTVNGHVEGAANNLHAFYVVGGTVDVNDTVIMNPAGDGLRVGAAADEDGKIISVGALTGSNVTISGAGRHGIWVTDGSLSVDGGTVTGLKNNNNNVLVTGGVASLSGMTLDTVNKNNNICVNGGELSLHDMTVHGNNTTDMGCHGLYVNGDGKVTSTGYLKLMDPAGAGIRIADNAVVSAANVTISNAGHYGMRITGNAQLTIDGLDISGTKINNVLVESGNVTLKNAVLNETNNNNIKLIGGHLTLETVEVLGHVEGSKSDVHGVFLEGTGVLDAKDLLIANTTGQALRVKGSEATVDGLILRNIGAGWLVSNTAFNGNPGKLSICGLGLSSGCSDADVVVHTEADGSRLELSDSLLSLGKDTIGVVVQGGEAVLDNVNINGGRYAVQNYASVTLLDSCLVRNVWSLRNETGAEAVLDGGFYFGNKEGTLPSDIYNDGVLTISDITVGYNRSGKGTSGVIYQAANASPIVLKGAELGVHTPSKPILLAAADWVKKWGQRVPIVICDSVDIAVDVENSFKEGKNDPVLYISQRDNHLELTTQGASATQPGGNYIVQIGEVRFESFADAFAYIEDNDEFNVTGDYKKAATIQVIDSYDHFEYVEIPEYYHIILVDDGDALRTITNNTDGHMFTVGEDSKLTIKSTDGTNPATGLVLNGADKEGAAVIHVNGGTVELATDLTVSNADYVIYLNGGSLTALNSSILSANAVNNGVYAVSGTLNDLNVVGTKGNGLLVNDEKAAVVANNLTVAGFNTGVYTVNGQLTVNGLMVDAIGNNVLLGTNNANVTSNAVMTVNGYADGAVSLLSPAGSNSVGVYYGATLNLNNVLIQGHDEGNTSNVHGIIVTGGAVNLDTVTIQNTVKAGIRTNAAGSVVNGKNVTIENTGTMAMSLWQVNAEIDGLTIRNTAETAILAEPSSTITLSDVTVENSGAGALSVNDAVVTISGADFGPVAKDVNNILVSSGKLTLNDAVVGKTGKSNNVCINGGEVNLHNVEILGNDVTGGDGKHIIYANGSAKIVSTGYLKLSDGSAAGIRLDGSANMTAEDVIITGTDIYGIRNGGSSYLEIGNLTTVNSETITMNYNIQADSNCTIKIGNATLAKTSSNNIVSYGGTIQLNGTVNVNGTSGGGGTHGVWVNGGTVEVNGTVNFKDADGAGIRIRSGSFAIAEVATVNISECSHGIQPDGGTVTINGALNAKDLTGSGINMYTAGAITVNGTMNIIGTGSHGVQMTAGTLNVASGAALNISNATANGIEQTGGEIVLNGTIEINGTGEIAYHVSKGTMNGSANTLTGTLNIQNAGTQAAIFEGAAVKVNVNELSVNGTGHDAVVNKNGSSLNVGTMTVSGATRAALATSGTGGSIVIGELYVHDQTGDKMTGLWLTATGSTTINGGKINVADDALGMTVNKNFSNTIYVSAGTVNLNGLVLGKSNSHNIAVAGGTVNLKDVQVLGTASGTSYGINVADSGVVNVLSGTTTVTDSAHYGVVVNGENAKLNLTGELKINWTGTPNSNNWALYAQNAGTITSDDGSKVTIDKAKYGLVGHSSAQIQLDQLVITNVANSGIYVHNSGKTVNTVITVDKADISNCRFHIETRSGIATINEATLGTSTENAIWAYGGTLNLKNATVGKSVSSVFYIENATVNLTDVELLGCNTNYGIYLVKGGSSLSATNLTINGTANSCIQQDGGVSNITNLVVGDHTHSHSVKLQGGTMTINGADIGKSGSNNFRVTGGTLNMTGAVDIAGTNSNNGIALDAAATLNVSGELTVGDSKNCDILTWGGVVNISGKVVADIHFDTAKSLNVTGALTEGSDVKLSWSASNLPADGIAVNFADADGNKDSAAWLDCKNSSKITLAASMAGYNLFYYENDEQAVAYLDPIYVTSEANLSIFLNLAKLKGEKNPIVPIAASFEVANQVDIDDSFDSVTVKPYDDGDYTITYTGNSKGLFIMNDGDTLTLQNLGLAGTNTSNTGYLLNQDGGELIIDGCTISGKYRNFSQNAGTATIRNSTFNQTSSNNVVISGTLTLEGTNTIHAHPEVDPVNIHGLWINGGNVDINDTLNINGALGDGMQVSNGAEVDIDGTVNINGGGRTGLLVASNAELTVNGTVNIANTDGPAVDIGKWNTAATLTIANGGKINIGKDENGNGIANNGVVVEGTGTLDVQSGGELSISNVTGNGIEQTGGEIKLTGTIEMDTITGIGYNVTGGGMNTAYDASKDTLTGTMKVTDTGKLAIYAENTGVKINVNEVVSNGTGGDAVKTKNGTVLKFGKLTASGSKAAVLATDGTGVTVEIGELIAYNQKAVKTALWLNASAGSKVTVNGGSINVAGEGMTVDKNFENSVYVNCGASDTDEAVSSVTLNNMTFGKTDSVNVSLSSGTTTLNNVTVNGTTAKEGIYVADNATLMGADITVTNSAGVGISNRGKIDISNLTISGSGEHNIYNQNVTGVSTTINGANIGRSSSNNWKCNIAIKNGTFTLKGDVVIDQSDYRWHSICIYNGCVENSTLNINGNLVIRNATGDGIEIRDGETDATINLNGSLTVDGVTGAGIRVNDGVLNIAKDATLKTQNTGDHGVSVDAGTVNLGGHVLADIYSKQAKAINVTGNLTEGSAVVVDWAAGKAPADLIVVNFADGTMDASKGYITLGEIQGGTYLLHFTTEGGKSVGKLVDNVITTETELNEYLAAATANNLSEATIVIGDSFAVTKQVDIPAGMHITITDDGTARTISRAEGTTELTVFNVAAGSNSSLTLSSTGTKDEPKLIISGAEGEQGKVWHLIMARNTGNLTVNEGVMLANSNAASGAAGGAIYADGNANVTINGAVFDNNTGTNGGAVAFYSTGKLDVDNAVFSNNTSANGFGGAIHATSGATVDISNTIFKSNTAAAKGQGGGALMFQGGPNVTITDCVFEENKALIDKTSQDFGGGAIKHNSGTLTIKGTTFKNNTTNSHGGAILNQHNLNIENCTFESNEAKYDGGAIRSRNPLTVTANSTFKSNSAGRHGGAICATAVSLKVQESEFTSNLASSCAGAVYIAGNVDAEITGSTLGSNQAVYGGAIFAEGTSELALTDCELTSNKGTGNSGALSIKNGASATVEGCTFENNAGNNSAAILVERAGSNTSTTTVTLIDTTLSGDGDASVVKVSHPAATINVEGLLDADIQYTNGLTLNVTGAMTGNVTVDWVTAPSGTAIEFASADVLAASKPYITLGSIAANNGYILKYTESAAQLVKATVVTSWTDLVTQVGAVQSGAEAYFQISGDADWSADSVLTIPEGTSITLLGTEASPAITRASTYTAGSLINVPSGATLTLRTATGTVDAPQLTISGGDVAATAQMITSAGNLNVLSGVQLSDSVMSGKQAGAAIYATGGTLALNGAVIKDNVIQGAQAGAVFVNNLSQVSVTGSLFSGNEANSGGAISGTKATVNISGTTFQGNIARKYGGAIFTNGTLNLVISDSKFDANKDQSDEGFGGGAILLYKSSSLKATNTDFINNSATGAGGAVHVDNNTATFINCTFTGNTATKDYSAVSVQGTSNVTASGCAFGDDQTHNVTIKE